MKDQTTAEIALPGIVSARSQELLKLREVFLKGILHLAFELDLEKWVEFG